MYAYMSMSMSMSMYIYTPTFKDPPGNPDSALGSLRAAGARPLMLSSGPGLPSLNPPT